MSAISDKNPLYRARKRRNAILLSLSVMALAYGLLCLLWILVVLLIQGGEALSHASFEREAARQTRILPIGLHPHLMGVPHRWGDMERMIDFLQARADVCFMTGSQVADWYTAQASPPSG